MSTLGIATKATRKLRPGPVLRQRFYASTTGLSGSGSAGQSGLTHGLVGGLAGGGLVFLGGYSYYHFSGKFRGPINRGES